MKGVQDLLQSSRVRLWLAIAGSATIVIGTAYTMVQQSTRLSADDLPLATAQMVKQQLEQGTKPEDVVPKTTINLRTDVGVFVSVSDKSQKVLASNVSLDGEVTLPPQGAFDYTLSHGGTDHFSWQPVSGVRQATRILAYNGGYVITGQSLKPFEDRVNTYSLLAILGWLAMMVWSFALIILPSRKPARP